MAPLLVTLMIAACASSAPAVARTTVAEAIPPQSTAESPTVVTPEPSPTADFPVRVVVEEFVLNASWDTYADGSCVRRSASSLRVVEPPAHADRRITIVHAADPGPESMWRDIGSTYDILVPELIFDGDHSREYGPGSVKILRHVDISTETRANN